MAGGEPQAVGDGLWSNSDGCIAWTAHWTTLSVSAVIVVESNLEEGRNHENQTQQTLGKLKKTIDPSTLDYQLNEVFCGNVAGRTLAERMYNVVYAGELAGLVDSRIAAQIYDMCAEKAIRRQGRKPYVPGPIVSFD